MNQFLKYLNFLGILALALLCAGQWKTNSWLNAQLFTWHEKSNQQAVTITQQAQTLKENAADLDDFRQRLTLAESQLTKAETDLVTTRQQRDHLAALRDKLLAAVTQRDQVIKEQTDGLNKQVDSIHLLEHERDQAIVKFNDLVTKYNALVSGQKTGEQ